MAESILWLDTDAKSRKKVEEFLHAASYAVDGAGCGAEALSKLTPGRYQVFATVLQIPDGDGISLIRQARERDGDLACMLVASELEVEDAVRAIGVGVCDFISVPIHLDRLVVLVNKALQNRKLMIENRLHQVTLEQQVRAATEELEKANQELRRTQEYLNNLLNSSVDSVLTLDMDLKITYANRGVTGMLGHRPEGLLGREFDSLLRGGEAEARGLLASLNTGPVQNHETELRRQGGLFVPVIMSLSQVHDHEGNLVSLLAICKDITKQKQLESELKEKTITDSLTGLYNQRYFYDRLEAEIERARRQKHPLSLLLFDVDHFKDYNDAHGHLEGDRLLKVIGEVVRESTRDYVDISCRYGGDEFTVILPETDLVHARSIAERIRSSFEARHFDNCTLSVGLMTYLKDTTPQSFIRFADEMMYDAKRSGGNRVYVFHPQENRITREQ